MAAITLLSVGITLLSVGLAPPRPATAATDPHGSFEGTNSAALATEASLDMTCLASLGSDFCDDDCGLAASTGDTDA